MSYRIDYKEDKRKLNEFKLIPPDDWFALEKTTKDEWINKTEATHTFTVLPTNGGHKGLSVGDMRDMGNVFKWLAEGDINGRDEHHWSFEVITTELNFADIRGTVRPMHIAKVQFVTADDNDAVAFIERWLINE